MEEVLGAPAAALAGPDGPAVPPDRADGERANGSLVEEEGGEEQQWDTARGHRLDPELGAFLAEHSFPQSFIDWLGTVGIQSDADLQATGPRDPQASWITSSRWRSGSRMLWSAPAVARCTRAS